MFKNNQMVMVYNIGDKKEYRAKICGIADSFNNGKECFYIIEIIDNFKDNYNFSHCVMTQHCLKPQ